MDHDHDHALLLLLQCYYHVQVVRGHECLDVEAPL